MEGNGETRPYSRPTTHPLDIPNFVSSSGLAMQQQRQQLSPSPSPSPSPEAASKRLGMPPSHPNNPMRPTWQHQMGPTTSSVSSAAVSSSLSQPSFFSLDSLPPLSPSLTYREQPSLSDPLNSVDVSMEDTHSSNPFWGGGGGGDGLPPRKGHRRSSSDVPLGFSAVIQSSPQLIPIGRRASFDGKESSSNNNNKAEIVDDLFSAYMNLDNIDKMSSPCGGGGGDENNKDLDSRASGGSKTNGGESSDNEVESGLNVVKREGMKRSAGGDLTRTVRHCRSVSMDSYMDNLNFDEELLKPLALGGQVGQQSPGGNSVDGNSGKFSMEFGSGEFNAIELKKIMESEKLSEIAVSDPKRAKRILANRQSAARSKERKMRYIVELEHKVQTLQTEATTLSAQVTKLQRDSMGLTSENNELKFRLQALEQQAQLKDALNEALTGEVQRLRITAAELGGEGNLSNRMSQQHLLNQQMLQLQQLNLYQMQQQPQHQAQQQQQQQIMQQQPQQNRPPSHQQNDNAPKHESI